jgi:hypothetical protein
MNFSQDHTCVKGVTVHLSLRNTSRHITGIPYSSSHPQFRPHLQVGVQFHVPAASSPENEVAAPIDYKAVLGFRVALNILEKREIPCPCRVSNLGSFSQYPSHSFAISDEKLPTNFKIFQ